MEVSSSEHLLPGMCKYNTIYVMFSFCKYRIHDGDRLEKLQKNYYINLIQAHSYYKAEGPEDP